MDKFVVRDFLNCIRWENVKKNLNISILGYWVFILCVWLMNISNDAKFEEVDVLFKIPIGYGFNITPESIYFVLFFVMIIGWSVVAKVTRIRLPKPMYMVPSTAKERECYLVKFWITKLLFGFVSSIVFVIIIYATDFVPIVLLPSILISVMAIIVSMSVTSAPGSVNYNQKLRDSNAFIRAWSKNPNFKNLLLFNILNMICAFGGLLIGLGKSDMNADKVLSMPVLIAVYVLAAGSIIFSIRVGFYIKHTISACMDYETGCEIDKLIG